MINLFYVNVILYLLSFLLCYTQCAFCPGVALQTKFLLLKQMFETLYIWGVLREYGVDECLLLAVKSLYSC